MMGGYGWDAQGYNLSDQQRSRLRTIQQQLIKQQTPLMQQMVAHRGELQSLYMDPTTEPKAISDEYGQLFSLRQKMIQNMLEARKQAADVLGQGTSQHQGESQGQ
ncbi:Spy/CpxP family protein refolding chaperone [Salinicola peritrichatus]|uniref:Spy/CpxP family protein refolding chaperone n=1 Tax=Salinicola peritrichatus TaxID=1267424 RepID=UPI000DA1425A|nr:periplasmic heavy metal sensor [Salinicola peritrichatus]